MAKTDIFEKEYRKLNLAQKEAVDTIDGPVMVVAGPGTGKTQIIALRIGNILLKTDTKAESILCLTFTNSAVEAMRERLVRYIGETGQKVNVFTFHSFGMKIIENYRSVLGFLSAPKLLEDTDTVILFDEILNNNDWKYLYPRSDTSRYFRDLRSLISLLKRERITPQYFLLQVKKEIKSIESDPENISSKGESKGELKKEFITKIEGLNRSLEVAKFFDLYEQLKKEKNILDYDDVLENLVAIVEKSKDARADIEEQYLYVLVDEHQDSSRVQNEFLKIVWAKVEAPNIFVVGDDRQLIYGFSGASIDHFQGFKKTFRGSSLITLVDNYRSTQVILDVSHALLRSVMTDEKLISQSKEHHPIRLFEAEYAQEEIMSAARDIKEKIKNTEGGDKGTRIRLEDCAILVSKNVQVRNALLVLHKMGLPVSPLDALNLFDQENANAYLRVLKIISDPNNGPALALSFFDKLSGITPLKAHKYLVRHNMREFSLDSVLAENQTLFGDAQSVQTWIHKLREWREDAKKTENLIMLIEKIGEELLLCNKNDDNLVAGKEILSTILSLATKELEKNPDLTLTQFIAFVERLESYGEHIPIVLESKEGVKVLTLHSSKGLEFDYVWIAHLDEGSLYGGGRMGFVLPKLISEKVIEQDIDRVKRKLYVAITRAKRFCTLSYSLYSAKDSKLKIAKIISDLSGEVFQKQKINNDNNIFPRAEARAEALPPPLGELVKLVAQKYKDRYVSVSLLNNFFECPWKWYFRNLLALPQPKIEVLEFGSAVHLAIDQILKTKKEILSEDKEVAEVVSRWFKNRYKDIAPNRENEKSVSVKDERFPDLKIYGKIDLVEYLDSSHLRVTDFKTGSVRKKSDIEKMTDDPAFGGAGVRMSAHLRQLAMYSYLLTHTSKVNMVEGRLEFLEAKNEKGAIYDRVMNPEEIALLVKDIMDYDKLVKTGEWIKRECNYNSYGKNTECEYCKLAEIYV